MLHFDNASNLAGTVTAISSVGRKIAVVRHAESMNEVKFREIVGMRNAECDETT